MADNNVSPILSIYVTTSAKVKDLPIADGQLVFVKDLGRIAMDFNNTRKFYNQITEIDTEYDRRALSDPAIGYYFVIDTATLWYYKESWVQITSKPEEIVFIGDNTQIPELGQAKTLYVNKDEQEISIWNEETNQYLAVSNYTQEVSIEDIESLFK